MCSLEEGYQQRMCLGNENRKREPKAIIRVGCETSFVSSLINK